MTPEQMDQLAAPFPDEVHRWLPVATSEERGQVLVAAYIQRQTIMDRLDAVLGPAGWADEYYTVEAGAICMLRVRVGDEWVTRSDAGSASDIEPLEGAMTTAFKRAAVKWGVGRYLLSARQLWVPGEKRGRSWVPKTPPSIQAALAPRQAQRPQQAAPEVSDAEDPPHEPHGANEWAEPLARRNEQYGVGAAEYRAYFKGRKMAPGTEAVDAILRGHMQQGKSLDEACSQLAFDVAKAAGMLS